MFTQVLCSNDGCVNEVPQTPLGLSRLVSGRFCSDACRDVVMSERERAEARGAARRWHLDEVQRRLSDDMPF